MVKYNQYTKKQAISVIVSCAKKYHDELENRSLLLVCQDKHKNIKYQEVSFYKRNFMHLTGVKVKKGKADDEITASNFYEKCLSHSLSPSDFEVAPDGTTFMKLDVLPTLITKNISAQMIGDYNSPKPKLYTEKLAGNVKACMGFRTDDVTGNYIPDTVLNEDIRSHIVNPARVIAVFRTAPSENDFIEITYIAKGIDLAAIIFPEPYQYLKDLITQ